MDRVGGFLGEGENHYKTLEDELKNVEMEYSNDAIKTLTSNEVKNGFGNQKEGESSIEEIRKAVLNLTENKKEEEDIAPPKVQNRINYYEQMCHQNQQEIGDQARSFELKMNAPPSIPGIVRRDGGHTTRLPKTLPMDLDDHTRPKSARRRKDNLSPEMINRQILDRNAFGYLNFEPQRPVTTSSPQSGKSGKFAQKEKTQRPSTAEGLSFQQDSNPSTRQKKIPKRPLTVPKEFSFSRLRRTSSLASSTQAPSLPGYPRLNPKENPAGQKTQKRPSKEVPVEPIRRSLSRYSVTESVGSDRPPTVHRRSSSSASSRPSVAPLLRTELRAKLRLARKASEEIPREKRRPVLPLPRRHPRL